MNDVLSFDAEGTVQYVGIGLGCPLNRGGFHRVLCMYEVHGDWFEVSWSCECGHEEKRTAGYDDKADMVRVDAYASVVRECMLNRSEMITPPIAIVQSVDSTDPTRVSAIYNLGNVPFNPATGLPIGEDQKPPTLADAIVAEVDTWTDDKRAAVYYVLNRQGMRIDKAETVWRRVTK